MNLLGVIVGLLIVGFIVWGISAHRKTKDLGDRQIPLFGFTLIKYNVNQMSPIEAETFGIKLRKIAERAWPELQRIYKTKTPMRIEWIKLDKDYRSEDLYHGKQVVREIIELERGRIKMRPQGGKGHPGEFWFALELHNLFRTDAFGRGKIYLSDYKHTQEEADLWLAANEACKDAAV